VQAVLQQAIGEQYPSQHPLSSNLMKVDLEYDSKAGRIGLWMKSKFVLPFFKFAIRD